MRNYSLLAWMFDESAQNGVVLWVVGNQFYNLGEGYHSCFIWVHYHQQLRNYLIGLLTKLLHYIYKLVLLNYPIRILILQFKHINQWFQQFLMILQLKIQNRLQKHSKFKFELVFRILMIIPRNHPSMAMSLFGFVHFEEHI